MKRSLVLRSGAKQDIKDGIDWYRSQAGAELGQRFLLAVAAAIGQIEKRPDAWSRWQRDARYQRVLVKRFPFVVFYKLTPKQIRIVAVAHTKRAPGYWQSR